MQKLVVIGGGPAGCACAIEAAALGLDVMLIDEHPQAVSAMSFDAPYFYGSRLPAQLSDTSAVTDAVLGANEPLMEALEAGVDVLTSTCAWGVFGAESGDPATRGRQVGLADQERSWIVDYGHLVLAPGARDLVLSFPKWELPGVLGVKGAAALLGRYGALGGGRVLILGSGTAALAFAHDALAAGIEVAGIVEAADEVIGPEALADALRQQDIPFFLSHSIREAHGVTQVDGATLVPVAADGTIGPAVAIACDTICMAFGAVPNIELASVAGCAMTFNPVLGGWVPQVGADQETSVEGIYAVGDGAGVVPATVLDDALLMEQGRRAARAIARRAGLMDAGNESPAASDTSATEASYPPDRWLNSLLTLSGEDVIVCQCEEVTRRELVAVMPPRYLHASDRGPVGGLASMGEGSRRSQDAVKRMTRVGMGHCQGRRCRDQGAMLLARASRIQVAEVRPGSYRVPVRLLPVELMSGEEETPEMRDRWPYWLWEPEGIPEKAE